MKDTGYRESQAADMLSGLPFWEHLEHAQKKYAEDHAVFRVENIPAMVVMKEGKVAELAVGYRPKEQITDMLKRA